LRGKFGLSFWVLIMMMVLLPSCGSQTINFPAPTVKSIKPATAVQNSPQILVTVTGSNFVQGSTIGVSASPSGQPLGLLTQFVDQQTLTGTLTAAELTVPTTLYFSVTTPQPGGGVYPPANQTKIQFPFIITPAESPVPTITSITPTNTTAATAATVTIFITGKNFVPQSVATLNGKNISTTFSSPSSISADVSSTDLLAPGIAEIAVLNPAPGGGTSNQVPLNILDPVPTITSVTPTSIQAGTTAPTVVTVAGSGYVNQLTQITLNGAPLQTTILSNTQASVTLTAGDLALAGVDRIAVANPSPGGGTSNVLTFAVNPTHLIGLPVLVDLAADGSQANTGICGGTASCQSGAFGLTLSTSGPSTSNTGQFVGFASASHNLVLTDTNPATDAYLRNTCLGVASCVPLTSVISLGPNGAPANGSSSEPTIDTAGTNAAFTSLATNLVTAVSVPSGTSQVYWRPICVATATADCTSSTSTAAVPQLVSISADGLSAGNGASYNPVISNDGRYVAFVSLATNLVSNITPNGTIPQVYVHDTCSISTAVSTGTCTPTTYLVSTPDGATSGDGPSSLPSISNSGLFVSFTSKATNLGATAPNPSGLSEIFERSTCATTIGTSTNTCQPVTTLISTPDGTTPADGVSDQSSLSSCGGGTSDCGGTTTASNGRFIAFASTAQNLVAGVGPTQQIYVRDTCNNVVVVTTTCTPATYLVSTSNGGVPGNGLSERPSISASGQFIAFASLASNLANSVNGIENIFVRNTCLATVVTCTQSLAIASVPAGKNASPSNGQNYAPSISADGHTVSFISFSNNLVPRDTNGLEDIFLGSTTY
jgi:WD40-like Beta Propeller Repeat